MKREWLLDYIKNLKAYIDKHGNTDLMMWVGSMLPLLEEDDEIILETPKIKAKDHLYITKGCKVDGKYVLTLTWIM